MDELIGLKQKRTVIKASLTRFHTYLKKFEALNPAERDKEQLIIRNDQNMKCLNNYEEIQQEIEVLDATEENDREEFEKSYFSIAAEAMRLLSVNQSTTITASTSGERSTAVTQPRQSDTQGVRLPTIELPKFRGSYETWLEFHDTFDSLIHNNKNISDIQKFHYLRASLTNEAAQVVASIEMSSSNYKIAWKLICDRYENTRLLIHNHTKAIFNAPSITRESSQQVRNLLDHLIKHLRSLEALKEPVKSWDTLLIFIVTGKLDAETIREWEAYTGDAPNFKDMKDFLKKRAEFLEKLELNTKRSSGPRNQQRSISTNLVTSQDPTCHFCNGPHTLNNCETFLKLSIEERSKAIQKKHLCFNCIRTGHSLKNCRGGRCRTCGAKHHTLLHRNSENNTRNEETTQNALVQDHALPVALSNSTNATKAILLSTAIVHITDQQGSVVNCRALLDSGSQSNFITEALCQQLEIPTTVVDSAITGIGQVRTNIRSRCTVEIKSKYSDFKTNLSCLVVPAICGKMPNVSSGKIPIPENIRLADPTYNQPSTIDLLIGAELFWSLTCVGKIQSEKGMPILQKTLFGWIISGPTQNISSQRNSTTLYCGLSTSLDEQLTRFWEIEEGSPQVQFSPEEQECELHFKRTTHRDSGGRFIVTIPLKETVKKLGQSQEQARRRFFTLERKLSKNLELKQMYTTFIQEYIQMNHASIIDGDKADTDICHYFPHHGILKEDSVTTKLRVVFDGSAPTSTGYSFNQLQMVGPTLQQDLFSILLRFRQHSIVVSADVSKMYRQIHIEPKQRPLQRIFWRNNPSEPLKTLQLNTVTYGTASAPYLAIRCLQQVAHDHQTSFPAAAQTILEDFYVDDLLTGGNCVREVRERCHQIDRILNTGCFQLRKWISNDPTIVADFNNTTVSHSTLNLGFNENTKTLGLWWSAGADALTYSINACSNNQVSKRQILSETAQIFDPLGLLAPCVITAKIMMQILWSLKLSWDEPIPSNLQAKWSIYRNDLLKLNNLSISRHVISKEAMSIELHGFCDASERAYGACIYVKSKTIHGNTVSLLCAKSKVAPLKSVSIPRLELCGALLLANLTESVSRSLTFPFEHIKYWTDSTVALSWINTSPHLLKTFCANRVTKIQSRTSQTDWHHVPTEDNPADLLSRGVSPTAIGNMKLWWTGPHWLTEDSSQWPPQPDSHHIVDSSVPDLRENVQTLACHVDDEFPFTRFSSLRKLKACVAYMHRFMENCKTAKADRKTSPLTPQELRNALYSVARVVQRQTLQQEYKCIKSNQPIRSSIRFLSPFIENDLIRVGGRLSNSELQHEIKHPILLPARHRFTKLIFINEHLRLLHAGPQQTLASVRQLFWPLSGRNTARMVFHECVKCFRVKPKPTTYQMGDLPASRCTPTPPFQLTGVDYAGPFLIKEGSARKPTISKAYICLFICFTIKAVHLELVPNLSTDAFIAALRRFTSRRGKPKEIYSDNGTNFTGADKELRKFLTQQKETFTDQCANDGIKWSFIPPYSPNFGGLWEGAVKATKHHIRRIMGETKLTYEQFTTLLTQIESILNSRPLAPLSNDPNDFTPLTPSHFLIGRVLTAVAEPNLIDVPTNRLTKYQQLQHMQQCFWTRWHKEYLTELQHRTKWTQQGSNQSRIGDMVILRDDNLPPLRWRLGRVIKEHPGHDGVCRVVSINTVNGVTKRALTKVCFLPKVDQGDEPALICA